MKEQFITFLKKHRCLRAYRKNLLLEKSEIFEVWADGIHVRDYLWSAFTWEPTPQGHGYWAGLADKWDSYLQDESSN